MSVTARALSDTSDDIAEAALLLRRGELVAFPTETVYGLGGDATNPRAVAAIYAAQGRPPFYPLISHFADSGPAAEFPGLDDRPPPPAPRVLPGPLTPVLPPPTDCALATL